MKIISSLSQQYNNSSIFPLMTIDSTSAKIISQFLIFTSSAPAADSSLKTLTPVSSTPGWLLNANINFGGVAMTNKLQIFSSIASGFNIMRYNNMMQIFESSTSINIVYRGNIQINASISVSGKKLSIISLSGNVTISKGVKLTADAIVIFAVNGVFQNNGVLTPSTDINIFTKGVATQNGKLTHPGNLLVNNILNTLTTVSCSNTLTILSMTSSSFSYTLDGGVVRKAGLKASFKGGDISQSASAITVNYGGNIKLGENLILSSSTLSLVLNAGCNIDTASYIMDISNMTTNNSIIIITAGGNVNANFIIAEGSIGDGGAVNITAKGSVSVQYSSYVITNKSGVSGGCLTILSGQDVAIVFINNGVGGVNIGCGFSNSNGGLEGGVFAIAGGDGFIHFSGQEQKEVTSFETTNSNNFFITTGGTKTSMFFTLQCWLIWQDILNKK